MIIDFFNNESYDTSKIEVIPFYKKLDVIDGYQVPFSNMINGYPITVGGVEFANVEIAYICSYYSLNNEKCFEIQKLIQKESNGMMCKRKYRKSNELKKYGRKEFDESLWHFHFMWFLVWTKCMQNKEFCELLKKIPENYIIIENEPLKGDKAIWGCSNKEYNKICRENSKNIKKTELKLSKNEIKNKENMFRLKNYKIGVWKGRNCMGKILMACRDALINDYKPPINYEILNNSDIYWFGKKLIFKHLC